MLMCFFGKPGSEVAGGALAALCRHCTGLCSAAGVLVCRVQIRCRLCD